MNQSVSVRSLFFAATIMSIQYSQEILHAGDYMIPVSELRCVDMTLKARQVIVGRDLNAVTIGQSSRP